MKLVNCTLLLLLHLCCVLAYRSSKSGRSLLREKYNVPSSIDMAAVFQDVVEDAIDDVTLNPTLVPSELPTLAPEETFIPSSRRPTMPTVKPSGPSNAPSQGTYYVYPLL